MRLFNKYWLEKGDRNEFTVLGKSFISQSAAMGGYAVDESYEDKQLFLEKWIKGRYQNYDAFITKFVDKTDKIFSVASGRCINELKLLNEGYDVTCSDLDLPACYGAAKKIFGDFKYEKLNALKNAPSRKYDKIICLGLICLLDKEEMSVFFSNMDKGLKKDGLLILELNVSPDNLLSYLLHDVYLRFETKLMRSVGRLFGKNFKRIKEIHGYRYKTHELLQIIRQNHFEVVDFHACEPLIEFQRSYVLKKLIAKNSFLKKILTIIGSYLPYSRLFVLKKCNAIQ